MDFLRVWDRMAGSLTYSSYPVEADGAFQDKPPFSSRYRFSVFAFSVGQLSKVLHLFSPLKNIVALQEQSFFPFR